MINRELASQTVLINHADSHCGRAMVNYFAAQGADVIALGQTQAALKHSLDNYPNVCFSQSGDISKL
ncbi:MAG: hypothetical protein OIF38_04005, partial [Cellvibrionaceae bacterium]|nr:hypothetical protein [Cellvibrionaceae bacterium]